MNHPHHNQTFSFDRAYLFQISPYFYAALQYMSHIWEYPLFLQIYQREYLHLLHSVVPQQPFLQYHDQSKEDTNEHRLEYHQLEYASA